jgi:hypothetical protein
MPALSKNDIGSETSRLQRIVDALEDYASKLEGKNNKKGPVRGDNSGLDQADATESVRTVDVGDVKNE